MLPFGEQRASRLYRKQSQNTRTTKNHRDHGIILHLGRFSPSPTDKSSSSNAIDPAVSTFAPTSLTSMSMAGKSSAVLELPEAFSARPGTVRNGSGSTFPHGFGGGGSPVHPGRAVSTAAETVSVGPEGVETVDAAIDSSAYPCPSWKRVGTHLDIPS